ncbi:peptidoglycan-binding domain protein [Favolaschia claudopus]|uniref:Peptidoglycan-binding domain protein n=1 Tax=Favolaschia claudopus TaxID=2862362 RepID=A0AAW0CC63_9AGAR
MGRWTQEDSDEARLPEGMERIGYDSDTGRYYFRDSDGSVWQGAQGAEFSEMTRVSDGESSRDQDVEAAPVRADGYQPLATDSNGRFRYIHGNTNAYRTIFPFFLFIGVVLLLVWRLIFAPALAPPKNPCPPHTTSYLVQPGDSCWAISQTHGCSLDDLKKLNTNVNCDSLMPGSTEYISALSSS